MKGFFFILQIFVVKGKGSLFVTYTVKLDRKIGFCKIGQSELLFLFMVIITDYQDFMSRQGFLQPRKLTSSRKLLSFISSSMVIKTLNSLFYSYDFVYLLSVERVFSHTLGIVTDKRTVQSLSCTVCTSSYKCRLTDFTGQSTLSFGPQRSSKMLTSALSCFGRCVRDVYCRRVP